MSPTSNLRTTRFSSRQGFGPSSRLLRGEEVGGYKVLRYLASGGMGDVYLAVHTVLLREAVLKVGTTCSVSEEGQILARFSHPAVVAVYDYIISGTRKVLVMEYVRGRPLSDLVRQSRPPEEVVEVIEKILRGLEVIHAAGIVHRDVTPENILVAEDGSIKLIDFGLAKPIGASEADEGGVVLGTPRYLAPERRLVGAKADPRSDIYALGVILFELLTGQPPWRGEPEEILRAHRFEPVPPIVSSDRDIPPSLRAVVLKAMSKKPEERFVSVEDMREALFSHPVQSALSSVLSTVRSLLS